MRQASVNSLARGWVVAMALGVLAGCQSPPPLRQVAPDAEEKAINTPEATAQLKQKYEKPGGR